MNNLFDLATKELSQDAFLRWLIECANDNDAIASVSKAFLKWLTGRDGKVKVVRTVAQWHRIDIVAELFYLATRETVLLAIEDKVDSEEHDDQLNRYGGLLDPQKCKWSYDKKNMGKICQPIKAFYKTARLDPDADERNRVVQAGWTIFELDDIATFFNKYLNFENSEIIRHYAAHILRRKKDSEEISPLPMTEWNIVSFQTWFREKLRPFVGKELPQLILEGKIYQGHYFSCYASRRFEDKDDRGVCLEIIFRPEDENGIGGVLYPRNSDGQSHLPPHDAWNLSEDRFNGYREDLIRIVDRQSKNDWSAFKTPNRNASVRIGSFRETISLDGKDPNAILWELRDILEEFYWLFDADRETWLPKCRRATDSVYSKEYCKRQGKKDGKGKENGDGSTGRSEEIDSLIKEVLPEVLDALRGRSSFWRPTGLPPMNFFSHDMDGFLPSLESGNGHWTGIDGWNGREIYRFWVQPMTGAKGVRIGLELAPGGDDVDKMTNFNRLSANVRNSMKCIGGERFEKWLGSNKDDHKKTIPIPNCEKPCEPTESAVREAVEELLGIVEEWQKDQLTFLQSFVRINA